MPQVGGTEIREGGPILERQSRCIAGVGVRMPRKGVSQAMWVDRSIRLERLERFHFAYAVHRGDA